MQHWKIQKISIKILTIWSEMTQLTVSPMHAKYLVHYSPIAKVFWHDADPVCIVPILLKLDAVK